MECSGSECKTCGEFKIRPFEFNIYRVRGLNKPFTRTGRIFGNILHIIDSIIGVITFGYFDSYLRHELSSRDLNKLGQYIEKYGTRWK